MRPELKSAIELALQAGRATPEERRQLFEALAMNAPEREKLINSKAAAMILDSCVATLFRHEKRGHIHAIRRSKRSIRWRKSEVERLAAQGVEL